MMAKPRLKDTIRYEKEQKIKEVWKQNWILSWLVSRILYGYIKVVRHQGLNKFGSFFFLFVMDFVIHWNETAMGLHVFPIPIPPPTSLSTRSL